MYNINEWYTFPGELDKVTCDKIKKLGDSSLEKDFRKIIVRTFQDQKMNIEKNDNLISGLVKEFKDKN